MPRYRQLPVKTLDSQDVHEMPSDSCRLYWVLLQLVLDREGRGLDNAAWLRSKVFPLRGDAVLLSDIESWMDFFAEHKMIERYQVNGRHYFYSVNFHRYQSGTEKEAKSELPAPPVDKTDALPTPELLPTNSGVTPEELRVNADATAIQQQGNGKATTTALADAADAAKLGLVFRVYEQEIGPLTPFIRDDLVMAEKTYPVEWVSEAIRAAARANVRKMTYVNGILRDWQANGFQSPRVKSAQDVPKGNGKARMPVGVDPEVQAIIDSGR